MHTIAIVMHINYVPACYAYAYYAYVHAYVRTMFMHTINAINTINTINTGSCIYTSLYILAHAY